MVKVYVGGINVVSGEPADEDASTQLRRRNKIANLHGGSEKKLRKALQDYMVVPGQNWIDGIAVSPGEVRQFVAMPFGSGRSVEAQMTGKETTAGIQFEITPYKTSHIAKDECRLYIKCLDGRRLPIRISGTENGSKLKSRIQDKYGIIPDQQHLIFAGKQLGDEDILSAFGINDESTLHLIMRMRGGGPGLRPNTEDPQMNIEEPQMNIAAGGKIKQSIKADTLENEWQSDRTTVFNVQILNSATYRAVTGKNPPSKPMTVEDYAHYDLPFFEIYEEPSNVHGQFDKVKSVARIKGEEDEDVKPRTVGIVNPSGPLRPFRSVADLIADLRRKHTANFN